MADSIIQPTLGFEGYIFVGDVSAETSALTELEECSALKYGQTFSEVDATLQGNHGVKTYVKGQMDFSVGFDLKFLNIQSEEGEKILNAVKTRTPVKIHAVNKADGAGPCGVFYVFGQEISMDGDTVQGTSCTCRPAAGYPIPTWEERTA